MATRIDELEISIRSSNTLIKDGIVTIQDVLAMSGPAMRRIPNFGSHYFNELRGALETEGYRVPDDWGEWEKPKVGVNTGNAGKGRPKGSVNKSTQIAKDAIALAADKLGGAERLVAWAKEDTKNEAAFWTTIYPKLLPLQVNGAGEAGEHIHKVVREIVRAPHTDS